MKKFTFSLFLFAIIFLLSSSFYLNKKGAFHHPLRSGGAATQGGAGRTGAPFDASTCANCHAGGSFGSSINVQLLDGTNTSVTNYIPNNNYTLRITLAAANGTPLWGFQTTSVQASTSNNLNAWGSSLPVYATNFAISNGRNYVEHITPLSNTVMNIPWKAPAASYGAVRFYSIGNAVDGTGGTGGDSPTASNILTIGESVVPVSLVSFSGKNNEEGNNLTWQTAQEINNDYFQIEHSLNGRDFEKVGIVKGSINSSTPKSYSFFHKKNNAGTNYYRLAQTDIGGKITYSPIITIENKSKNMALEITPNPAKNFIAIAATKNLIDGKYIILNNAGTIVLSGILVTNNIDIQKLSEGNYFIKIQTKENIMYTQPFVK